MNSDSFKNSLFREISLVKKHAVRFTNLELAKKCRTEDSYEEILSRNYEALLSFYRKNFLGSPSIDEAKALENWRSWMRERKKIQRRLGVKDDREPGWLVMNSAEDRRTELEIKSLLERAQALQRPDRYRGSPSFWYSTLPRSRCTCQPDVRHSITGGTTPPAVQEFIGVPRFIRQVEKGISGEHDGIEARGLWASSKYLRNRARELAANMSYINAYFPDTDLMVQGVGLERLQRQSSQRLSMQGITKQQAKPSQDLDLPRLRIEGTPDVAESLRAPRKQQRAEAEAAVKRAVAAALKDDDDDDDWTLPVRLQVGKVTLRCGKAPGSSDEAPQPLFKADGPLHADIDFQALISKRVSQALRIENTGRTSVAMRWVHLQSAAGSDYLKSVPPRENEQSQRFFFDKRDFMCPPGQVRIISVHFLSKSPGLFTELWELRFEPRLTPPEKRFLVRLWAVCGLLDEEEAQETEDMDIHWPSTRNILRYLERCVALAVASETVDELAGPRLQPARTIPPLRSLYLEDEVFEHVNPGYYYRWTQMTELRELWTQATQKPASEWDLSLQTLKAALRNPAREDMIIKCQQELTAQLHTIMRIMRTPMETPAGATRLGARAAAYAALCCFANAVDREAKTLRALYNLQVSSSVVGGRASEMNNSEHPAHSVFVVLPTSSGGSSPKGAIASAITIGLDADTEEEQCARDLYRSALFVRVFHLLGDAIDRMVAAVGSPAPSLLRWPPDLPPAPNELLCATGWDEQQLKEADKRQQQHAAP